MPVSKEERTLVAMIRTPQVPLAVVEGSWKGERRVIVCLVEPTDPKDPQGGYARIPIAVLLTDTDYPDVSLEPGKEPSKIILPGT